MPTTLKDIAEQSGYSVTTVSRALTGYDDVNETTRTHILTIAQQLGYQPNHVARQLQKQRTLTLGLVLPHLEHSLEDDFFSLLLKGITFAAVEQGYDVLISAADHNVDEIATYQRIAGGKRVDGMIVARTYRNDPRITYLMSIDIPFIVYGRLTPDTNSLFPYIDVDSQRGIEMAVEHLIERGHKRIGIILPPEDVAFTPYRRAGYQRALEKHHLAYCEDDTIYADLTLEGGKYAAQELLRQRPDLTAIVGCNDWMALGAMTVAKSLGKRIGDDFAVTGYDDIPAALHADPPLTSVHAPIYEIGERLTHHLIEMIDQPQQPTVEMSQRLITPSLVVRGSSGDSRPYAGGAMG
jgi:LacI family transcriptional regulator